MTKVAPKNEAFDVAYKKIFSNTPRGWKAERSYRKIATSQNHASL